MDATLKELTGLIKEVNPESRRRGTYFDFAIVYPDLRQGPRCSSRDIGTTVAGQKVGVQCCTWRLLHKLGAFDDIYSNGVSWFQGPDDNMTLKEAKFCIGDFLDVSINSPNSRMDRWASKSRINLISMWQVR